MLIAYSLNSKINWVSFDIYSRNKNNLGMMHIVYLLIAHKDPHQVIRLVAKLKNENTIIFIHFGKDASNKDYFKLVEEYKDTNDVKFLKRFETKWGKGIIDPVLEGIHTIIQKKIPCDFLILMSGQDYPLKTNEEIIQFFSENSNFSFINAVPLPDPEWDINISSRWENYYYNFINPRKSKFRRRLNLGLNLILNLFIRIIKGKRKFPENYSPYGGSAWWCLSREGVEYLNTFTFENPEFIKFFEHVFIPDEIFFQTVLVNSPLKNKIINSSLTYDDWSTNAAHPKLLCVEDYEKLLSSGKLFARKFDETLCPKILDMIDNHHPQD